MIYFTAGGLALGGVFDACFLQIFVQIFCRVLLAENGSLPYT
jgi:hypothetical protein